MCAPQISWMGDGDGHHALLSRKIGSTYVRCSHLKAFGFGMSNIADFKAQ